MNGDKDRMFTSMSPGQFSLVALLLVLTSCVSVPADATARVSCQELPSVGECQATARAIEDECLRDCVLAKCTGIKIRCDEVAKLFCPKGDYEGGRRAGFVFRGGHTCEQPAEEMHWCEEPMPAHCRAQAMVHELAHACGWHHGDGFGVPGNKGRLACQ